MEVSEATARVIRLESSGYLASAVSRLATLSFDAFPAACRDVCGAQAASELGLDAQNGRPGLPAMWLRSYLKPLFLLKVLHCFECFFIIFSLSGLANRFIYPPVSRSLTIYSR